MLVIILAVIAIVTATVIMVMPAGKDKGKKQLQAPPAPERMETNPNLGKQSQIDPWSQPDDYNDPNSIPRGPIPRNPSPQPPPDPDDLLGGLGGLGGGGKGGMGGLGAGSGTFMLAMFDKACAKMKQCPDIDQSMISTVCDQFSAIPKPPIPSNCPSAQRCLDSIDKLSCTQAGSNNPLSSVYLITDCMTAINDC